MARMRSIKPEYWAEEELAAVLSRDARLLYIGLWNLADEHARLRGDARYIKGQLFAYDDDLTPVVIDTLVTSLVAAGRVVRYRVSGAAYLFLPKLAKHQRLEPAKVPSRLPAPEDADPDPPPPTPISDELVRRANKSAPNRAVDSGRSLPDHETVTEQPKRSRANLSARNSDESALACARSFKHVAGSREHVAGSPNGDASARATSGAQIGTDLACVAVASLPAPAENAGTILAEWIDYCRSHEVRFTKRITGQYAKGIKNALDQGFPPTIIKRALAGMLGEGVADRPSYLDNHLVRAQAPPPRPRRRPTAGEDSARRMVQGAEDEAQVVYLVDHFFDRDTA